MGWDTGGGGAAASASINFTGAGGESITGKETSV